jgi:hypothetical protein
MHCCTSSSSLYGYICIRHGLQAVLHQMDITNVVCLLGTHLLDKYAAAHIEALSPAVPCIMPSICIACIVPGSLLQCCRYATLGKYPSWQLLLEEWKEGIPYLSTTIGTRKQPVPMAQLEQDWAEGVQRKNSSSVPWRSLDRNSIRDRKVVIYGLLQAELQGQDFKEFMAPHVAAAKSLMEKSGTGAKPTLLTYIK